MLLNWTYLYFEHRGKGRVYLKTDEKYSVYEHMASPRQHDFFIKNCYNKGITEMTLRQFNDKMKAETTPGYYETYLKFDMRTHKSVKYPPVPLNEGLFRKMLEYSKYPYGEKELADGLREVFDRINKSELSAMSKLRDARQMDNMISIIQNISNLICKEIERYK